MTEYRHDAALRRRVSRNLAAHAPRRISGDGLRLAAVTLTVTTDTAGRPAIVLTRRPARMGRHANQFALPGGRIDPGETAAEAARREQAEEIGLDLDRDAMLGRLDDFPTRSGFRITPFVFWAGAGAMLTPAPGEVAAIYLIPFEELDSDAIPLFDKGFEEGRPVLYSNFPSIGEFVYTPTASIIYQFREVALRGRDTPVAHFDQPKFAWK